MPSLQMTQPSLRDHGPIILVTLGHSRAVYAALGREKALPDPIQVNALIDTGARSTCISRRVAAELNLPPHDITQILTAGEPTPANIFTVRLSLAPALNTHAALDPFRVIEAPLVGQDHIDCLIGRDILAQGTFIYLGQGNTFHISM